MTERELEERLRTWYRSRATEPPPALIVAVSKITREAEMGTPRMPLQLAAAVVVSILAIAAVALGGALVGTFLREPVPVVPDATATPPAEPRSDGPVLGGPFDACLALSADALDRLFPGIAFTSRHGGPELAEATGDWSPQRLGVPVRSCLYEAEGLAIAVHVPIESTRLGEASFVARRFLGADISADAWPWSVEREDGSAALIVTRSSAVEAGYLVALTMRLSSANRPAMDDIGIEVFNGLNALLAVPDPCEFLDEVIDGAELSELAAGDGEWRTCRLDSSGGSAVELSVFARFVAFDRADERLGSEPGVPGIGVLERHGDRWRTRGAASGVYAVGVSCEPILFVVSSSSEAAAADLAQRVVETACPDGAATGGAP